MFKLGLGSAVVSDDQIKGLLRVSSLLQLVIQKSFFIICQFEGGSLVLKWKPSFNLMKEWHMTYIRYGYDY